LLHASFSVASPARKRVAHSGFEMTRIGRFVGKGTMPLQSITNAACGIHP
jgi:tRNA U34 5-methylaminomethyl-2-thiouridine-forming methyltransferase MnmC